MFEVLHRLNVYLKDTEWMLSQNMSWCTQPHRAILLTANQPGVKKWPGMKLHDYGTHIPHSTTQHTPHGTTVSLKAEVKVVGGDDKVGPRMDQPGVEGEGRWQCRTKHFRAT
ncbi:hypothetical protein O3P69_015738 [Scylla paramamosain]|uniref:Uncharacterized protein n=1 Tax=Scylla paramamosain TaxID=85552 RepID=A0AAW0T9H1_SCYPA